MLLTEEDKKFIAKEERLLESTLRSLCRQLPQVQAAKISANEAARELTRQVVNEWNHEERQPLVSDEAVAHRILDIRKNNDKALYELIQEPYFGRVCTKEDDGSEVSFLIGKKAISKRVLWIGETVPLRRCISITSRKKSSTRLSTKGSVPVAYNYAGPTELKMVSWCRSMLPKGCFEKTKKVGKNSMLKMQLPRTALEA